MRELRRLGVCLVILTVLAGCSNRPQLAWETLDQYDFNAFEADPDFAFPAAHLYERLYFSRAAAGGGIVNDSVIQFRRDSILIDTLVSLGAADYDLTPHWYQWLELRGRTGDLLRRDYWRYQVGDFVEVDTNEVEAYYEAHLEEFTFPEQAEVYHILSSPLGFLQSADSVAYFDFTREDLDAYTETYIRHLYQLLAYGEAFENVAHRYSHDINSAGNSGRIGWIAPRTFLDPFDSVTFGELENGEYSEPYQDGDGWHLIYRTNYYPGGARPLDSANVWDACYDGALNEKAARLTAVHLDSLRGEAQDKVEISDLVSSAESLYDIDDTLWAVVVGETDTAYFYQLKSLADSYVARYRAPIDSPDVRLMMAGHLASPLVVEQAARRLGYDTLPDFVERRTILHRTRAKAVQLAAIYGDLDWKPTEAAVSQYYDSHWDDFHPRDHIRAEQLIVQEIELAHFLREQAGLGMTFREIHEFFGPEGEGYNIIYEDLGVVKEGRLDPELEDAIQRTHQYHLSQIVETKQGFHIAQVSEREYDRSLREATPAIETVLTAQYRRQLFNNLRDELIRQYNVRFPGTLPEFYLPQLSDRNHPRTLAKPIDAGRR